ncbi:MAG: HD-GYP domain-containing protein [Candidatus Hydrogenedentota bacterium]
MRIIRVADLQPGNVVGRALLDEKGQTLLQRGVTLSEGYIQALKAKGYTRLYVQDTEVEDGTPPEEDISPATRALATQTVKKSFEEIEKQFSAVKKQSYDDVLQACNSDGARVLLSNRGPLANIDEVITSILGEVLSRSTLAGLTSIKSADSQLYNHSVDVCVVALMIGRTVNLSNDRLRQLAAGCLLHDIGMVFVESNVGRINMIRHHTRLGYELLKNGGDPDLLAPHVAYEHHERQDGGGLPRGLRSGNRLQRDRSLPPPIPTLIGEIAAVADAYDNLLSGGPDGEGLTPDAALMSIRKAAGPHFNKEVVEAFLRVTPVYPVGTEIIVRSEQLHNYSGVVREVNPEQLDRPVISLLRNNYGRPITPIEVDLAEQTSMMIRCRGL